MRNKRRDGVTHLGVWVDRPCWVLRYTMFVCLVSFPLPSQSSLLLLRTELRFEQAVPNQKVPWTMTYAFGHWHWSPRSKWGIRGLQGQLVASTCDGELKKKKNDKLKVLKYLLKSLVRESGTLSYFTKRMSYFIHPQAEII